MKQLKKLLALLLVLTCAVSSATICLAAAPNRANLLGAFGDAYQLSAEMQVGGQTEKTDQYQNDAFHLEVSETANGLTAYLTAKKDLTMKKLALNRQQTFEDGDRFFANGYQSWSTTQEYCKTDKTMPAIQLAMVTDLTWQMATCNSDYKFASYGEPGVFHSWTLTYFRKTGSQDITFYGSRSERNGFTMFEADMQNGRFTIAKDIDGLKLKAGQKYLVFDLFKETGNYEKVFDDYFFQFMNLQRPKVNRMTGYTSWYNLGQMITERTILRDLNGLDRAKDRVSIFQIDDGYESAVGDWTDPNPVKFPHGMKYLADQIHQKGYQAGLWLAPFEAQITSKVARHHRDWLLRDENGHPVLGNSGWGGAYALDISNPEVKEYLSGVFRTVFDDWGFDMVKLDFLYAACMQPRDDKTRGQLMAEACDFLREVCGNHIILGCGVPLGSAMGVFDACRIGPDQDPTFTGSVVNKLNVTNEVPSARYGITNSIFRRFFDGRAFANDTDVFYLRNGVDFTDEQKMLLAKINDMTGSVLFMSDNAGDYTDAQMAMLRQIYMPKDYSIQLAEMTDSDHFSIQFTENGTPKTLRFNIASGEGNIREVW